MPLKKTEKAVHSLSVYKQQKRRPKKISIYQRIASVQSTNSLLLYLDTVLLYLMTVRVSIGKKKKIFFCTFMQSRSLLVFIAWISHIKLTFSDNKVCTAGCTLFTQSCYYLQVSLWNNEDFLFDFQVCTFVQIFINWIRDLSMHNNI